MVQGCMGWLLGASVGELRMTWFFDAIQESEALHPVKAGLRQGGGVFGFEQRSAGEAVASAARGGRRAPAFEFFAVEGRELLLPGVQIERVVERFFEFCHARR